MIHAHNAMMPIIATFEQDIRKSVAVVSANWSEPQSVIIRRISKNSYSKRNNNNRSDGDGIEYTVYFPQLTVGLEYTVTPPKANKNWIVQHYCFVRVILRGSAWRWDRPTNVGLIASSVYIIGIQWLVLPMSLTGVCHILILIGTIYHQPPYYYRQQRGLEYNIEPTRPVRSRWDNSKAYPRRNWKKLIQGHGWHNTWQHYIAL